MIIHRILFSIGCPKTETDGCVLCANVLCDWMMCELICARTCWERVVCTGLCDEFVICFAFCGRGWLFDDADVHHHLTHSTCDAFSICTWCARSLLMPNRRRSCVPSVHGVERFVVIVCWSFKITMMAITCICDVYHQKFLTSTDKM